MAHASPTPLGSSKPISKELLSDATWKLLKKHYTKSKGYQLVKHLLDSYNDFELRKIDDIIEGFNKIECVQEYVQELDKFKYVVEVVVKNPRMGKPMIIENNGSTKVMTPTDGRNRNFSYVKTLTVDMDVEAKTLNTETGEYSIESKSLNNVSLGKIPQMVSARNCILSTQSMNTDECRYDFGGYFVINGNEKVVISQDRIAENKAYVFTNNKVSAYSHIAEIRSVMENKFSVPKTTTLKLSSKPNQFGRFIRANIHHVKADVPLFILFRALGVESDKDIMKFIVYDLDNPDNEELMRNLIGSIEESNNVLTQREALDYLSRHMNVNGYPRPLLQNRVRRMGILRGVLEKEFLPHVGVEFHKKALYLGYMVNKLLRCYLGVLPLDDRDSYINKRIDTPGVLMANILRQYYGKVVKDFKNTLQKDMNSGSWKAMNKLINVVNKNNIQKAVKSTIIDSGMKYSLATGNWGIKSNKPKQGVAQVLNRLSYNAAISHLRRINTPVDKTGKLIQPRKLHGTQMGVICPAETPEGVSVGLVKNLSVMGSVTIGSDSTNLREILKDTGIVFFDGNNLDMFARHTKIFVNGDLIGVHQTPHELYQKMKFYKRKSVINAYTGIVWNIPRNELWFCTEGGRCVRPVYVVDKGNQLRINKEIARKIMTDEIEFQDLVVGFDRDHNVDDSVIEFLDVEECNTSMLAMKYEDLTKGQKGALLPIRYTHMEIDPSLMMGVLAGSIPFSNHNQAPRNCYQCLWLEEDVLMADGTRKKIKDIRIGDEVVTFDNTTMNTSTSKVVDHFVKSTDKHMYELETSSGRTIKATFDHLFMTSNGWMRVEDIEEGTLVGIYPYQKHVPNSVDEYIVLDESTVFNKLSDLGVKKSLIDTHIKKMIEVGILPLKSTSWQTPILARMSGYLVTDGSLNIYDKKHGGMTPQSQFEFGTLRDADKFEDEIENLGFQKIKILEGTRTFNGATHHTFHTSHNGAFASLMVALGNPLGKRTTRERIAVPSWIMHGSQLVKREFISGFQGGDGCMVRWNKLKIGYNFISAATSQSIQEDKVNSLIAYMNQIADLMSQFGIDIKHVKKTKSKDDGMICVALKMADTHANLINYFDTIGYRYAQHKTRDSALVIEYLKTKNVFSKAHTEVVHSVRSLHDQGVDNKTIAKLIGWTTAHVTDTIRSYKAGRQASTPKLPDVMKIDRWLESVESKGDMIFVPISKKTSIPTTVIADLSVESEDHSFIGGNNFAVHNSAMGKQAIGIYTSNFRKRYDTLGHVLNYPQIPLVQTRTSKLINTDKLPCGINAVVAIATFTGFNQEDSLIMNQSSVDRGLFSSTYYRTYKEQNNKNHSTGEEEYFCRPDQESTKQLKPYNYNKLSMDGFVPENTFVEAGDVMIGKCMPQKQGNVIVNKDTSVVLKNNEQGFVDRNCYNDNHFTNINGDGYSFAKVRLRSNRIPTIGDKFSCYTPDHEILTTQGWIGIADLTKEHKVATLVGDALVYQHPIAIQKYDYKGKIYCVKSNQVNLKVTPNHRMYVRNKSPGSKYNMELAEEIYGQRRHYKKNVDVWVPDLTDAPKELVVENGAVTKFKIDSMVDGNGNFREALVFDIEDWLKFFGIWMAEGCACASYVQFCADKPRVKEVLDLLEASMDIKICKNKYRCTEDEENSWRIHIKQLSLHMVQYSVGATNKRLPEWVWCLNRSQCQLLIEAMCLGDGHTMSNGTPRYDTSSTGLADDFMRLCLHAGYSTSKAVRCAAGYTRVKKDGSVIKTTTEAYRLTIIKSQNEPLVNKNKVVDDESSYLDSWEDYEGTVHCCTVAEGDGVLYVRRNGVPVLSGNSRHGQKGTNGMLYHESDMPFTKDGMRPDIIINPHAIPSRMTIGQLMECIMGKACVQMGTFGDGTAFSEIQVEDISEILEEFGYERYGNEILYNPRTGEQIPTAIFIGPTYYQRLKHMTADKMHSRSCNGPVVMLTRQPAEGRARDGGLRMGEMEVECNWAHGAMGFLKERFMECSDNYRVYVCKNPKCHFMATVNPEKNIYKCNHCGNTSNFAEIRIPYAAKLFFQEVQTMSIGTKFIT